MICAPYACRHMDRIVIISPTGEVYFFSYEDWIREGRLKVTHYMH